MADLTITAANVIAQSNVSPESGVAGGAITIGQAISRNSQGQWVAGQADDAATADLQGIALTQAAAAGQPVTIAKVGDLALGAGTGMTIGGFYVLSAAAAGGIAPIGDLASTNILAPIGYATTATNLRLINSAGPFNTGVAVA